MTKNSKAPIFIASGLVVIAVAVILFTSEKGKALLGRLFNSSVYTGSDDSASLTKKIAPDKFPIRKGVYNPNTVILQRLFKKGGSKPPYSLVKVNGIMDDTTVKVIDVLNRNAMPKDKINADNISKETLVALINAT